MPLFEEACQAVYPVYVDPPALRVTISATAEANAVERIPAGLLDRCRAAFAATDADADASPALRVTIVELVTPVATARIPTNLNDLLRAAFTLAADGFPALRVRL